jgi:hypothetical protein
VFRLTAADGNAAAPARRHAGRGCRRIVITLVGLGLAVGARPAVDVVIAECHRRCPRLSGTGSAWIQVAAVRRYAAIMVDTVPGNRRTRFNAIAQLLTCDTAATKDGSGVVLYCGSVSEIGTYIDTGPCSAQTVPMMSKRVPGRPPAVESSYYCAEPGCKRTARGTYPPICPIHSIPMKKRARRRSKGR